MKENREKRVHANAKRLLLYLRSSFKRIHFIYRWTIEFVENYFSQHVNILLYKDLKNIESIKMFRAYGYKIYVNIYCT